MQGVRIPSVESHVAPPGDFESWDDYMAAVEARFDRDAYDDCKRVGKAMRLAPSLEVFDALLAGQPVPASALDPAWRRRYGL